MAVEYTLILDSPQAAELLKAVELLMRLKINQPEEITWMVMPDDYFSDNGKVDSKRFDDYIERRDKANEYLRKAFALMFPYGSTKDPEWHRLYNLYQVIRYARHEAEFPDSTGVDSYPPMQFTDEPMPKCTWRK